MNKAERKRRAAARKKKAKLAKKAKRADANNAASLSVADKSATDTGDLSAIGADAVHRQADVAQQPSAKAEGPSTGSGQAARATTAGKMPAERADRMSTPPLSIEDEVHMSYSKLHQAETEMVEADIADRLGDDEAIAMLTRAARSLDNVIQYVESVLKRLPAEQVAEAIAIQDAPRRHGEKSRNGANPAVQLLNIRLRAKNLLMRVMKVLKPNLAKQLQTV